VVLVASVVARAAGVESEKGLQTLGLASFLHDIGLIHNSDDEDDLYAKDEEKFYDESMVVEKVESKKIYGDEKAMYESLWQTHPDRGACMIESECELPPLVAQIIRQHHGLRDKREGRSRGIKTHPMAEILEISDEFVRLMTKFTHQGRANKDVLAKKLLQVVQEYPRRTRDPFLEVFGHTKKFL
jgi:response regulator RpfG family c-di-GMP phosphodiesterase